MKYKAKLKKLQERINAWENSSVVKEANRQSPGTYMKPGSQKGR